VKFGDWPPHPKSASCIFGGHFDIDEREKQVCILEEQAQDPDFWNHTDNARSVLRQTVAHKQVLDKYKGVLTDLADLSELLEIAGEDELEDLNQIASTIEKQVDRLELDTMLCGSDDARNAILTVHPGAGGTESEDWAGMLVRMYRAFCDQQGWKVTFIDEQPGEQTGYKNASFEVTGTNVFGRLRSEVGVHRLVRISPFDSQSRRHTSFASVFLYPMVEDVDEVEIEVDPSDLRVDTFRASGAGGQHVNKTDSAIRLTHLPTGIVTQCQNERSQSRNRITAMKLLKARLLAKKRDEENERLAKLEGSKLDNAWGSQIRSYVLHPYNMVKDHRTRVESSDAQGVLGGRLDLFVRGFLLNPDLNRPPRR
jgi:peptide chain release factor 2